MANARPPGSEKCLRLLKQDAKIMEGCNVVKASRFGLDGKLSKDKIFVVVRTKADAQRLPRVYPAGNGKEIVPILESQADAASTQKKGEDVVVVSGRVKPKITSDLSQTRASNKVRMISGTKRSDGTVRKGVKIRAGFRSEELDVATYMSKEAYATAEWRRKGENYVPGLGKVVTKSKKELQAEKRAEKRRQQRARKKAEKVAAAANSGAAATSSKSSPHPPSKEAKDNTPPAKRETADDPATAAKKRLRAVNKKLRQIEAIKKKQSEGSELDDGQKAKLAGEGTLLAELEKLKIHAQS